MKKVVLLLLLTLSLHAGKISIAVAANVSYAIDTLKEIFAKTHPDTTVRVTLGSSGKLAAQIRHGAPYDLFMSANMLYPVSLYQEGLAVTKPVVYARGALAMFTAHPSDLSRGIAIVKDADIRKIAIANPATAPYGSAAESALKNAGLYAIAKPKLVYAESVSQTVTYALSAADIGFVAMSALYSPKMARFEKNRHWSAVDPKLYQPIEQGAVLLKHGQNNPQCREFYDFLLSDKAKVVLKQYGYLVE
ncbi:MAG TPA: molybdate ABC transporter substrate-binding protein [Sulfuricurvum sp.]|nr:molybdate ABC transporter substrate-binding protein [Sulfuricurvum sp.]